MSHARELGFAIQQLVSKDSQKETELCRQLGLTEFELQKLYVGRLFLTGDDLNLAAQVCGVEAGQLLNTDPSEYNKQAVHCMSGFQSDKNREMILDLIDTYIDAREALANR